jgi:nucleoside phosphorylase
METIFVAALKEETPNLNNFHHTGVGKINASIKLMELINIYKPTQIINYGTA